MMDTPGMLDQYAERLGDKLPDHDAINLPECVTKGGQSVCQLFHWHRRCLYKSQRRNGGRRHGSDKRVVFLQGVATDKQKYKNSKGKLYSFVKERFNIKILKYKKCK